MTKNRDLRSPFNLDRQDQHRVARDVAKGKVKRAIKGEGNRTMRRMQRAIDRRKK
jgi:hypothetical protein